VETGLIWSQGYKQEGEGTAARVFFKDGRSNQIPAAAQVHARKTPNFDFFIDILIWRIFSYTCFRYLPTSFHDLPSFDT